MKQLQPTHPALAGAGRTIFLKAVKSPTQVKRLLQPASANGKLGKGSSVIVKGKWKGMPMYSLSLEERKTCPTSCQQWSNCYGNNMPFANRVNHAEPDFLNLLEKELSALLTKHPSGIVIRLHVLGDFYSVPYVNFWKRQLKTHSNLHLFGYTHRDVDTPIGRAISSLNQAGSWIRWSDAGGVMSANTVPQPNDIICPEQTNKTESCLTCGLCWSTDKPIRFLVH